MDTNKMREQFESFAREVMDWSDDEFRLASDGKSYYWGATGEAWVFWQASREAVVVELPAMADPFEVELSGKPIYTLRGEGRNAAIRKCRTAIEAQGLKVAP